MATYIATIQAGHAAQSRQPELATGLKLITWETLGDDPEDTEVKWKVIPKGFGWTAGRPSNTSVVVCVVPDDIEYGTRVEILDRINRLWVGITGADSRELLIVTHGRAP